MLHPFHFNFEVKNNLYFLFAPKDYHNISPIKRTLIICNAAFFYFLPSFLCLKPINAPAIMATNPIPPQSIPNLTLSYNINSLITVESFFTLL